MYREPTVREQDEFLSKLGVDIFNIKVERVTITDDQGYKYKDRAGNPIGTMYSFQRDGQSFIAIHWPETDQYQDIT